MLRARALPLHTLPSTQSLARTTKSAAACAAPDPHWAAAAVAICAHPIERQRKHLPPETLPLRRARNVPAQAHTRLLNFGKRTRRARARVQASEFGVGATGIRVAEGEGQEHRTKVTVKINVVTVKIKVKGEANTKVTVKIKVKGEASTKVTVKINVKGEASTGLHTAHGNVFGPTLANASSCPSFSATHVADPCSRSISTTALSV